ncbi:hypothetical protein J7L68_07595 [bacterium]|nr:hypothetical protein [bacterium]
MRRYSGTRHRTDRVCETAHTNPQLASQNAPAAAQRHAPHRLWIQAVPGEEEEEEREGDGGGMMMK